MGCFLWISVLTFHTHYLLTKPSETLLLPPYQRWGDWSSERSQSEEVAEPRSVWIQKVEFDLILQMRKEPQRRHASCPLWAGPWIRIAPWREAPCTWALRDGRCQFAASSSVVPLCFRTMLSSIWLNKHLLDPHCVFRTFIFQSGAGVIPDD